MPSARRSFSVRFAASILNLDAEEREMKMRSFASLRTTSGKLRKTTVAAVVLAAIMLPGCDTTKPAEPDKKTFTLTVIAGEHGAVSPSGGSYKEGTVVSLTASPDAGYRIHSWTGTDNDASTATANAVTMTANKTVEVAFESQVREDFERAESGTSWVFGNGPEFPGANGSFAIVAGRGRSGSKGGVLAFDFGGGGNFVIAAQTFNSPVPLKGVSFGISGFVPGTRLIVRLTDEIGTTFQYYPMVSLEAGKGYRPAGRAEGFAGNAGSGAADDWAQVRVYLGDWDSYWGGAGDGVFHGGLRQIGIGVDKGVQYYKTGDFVIDNIAETISDEIAFDPFGADRLPEFYTGPVSARLGVNIHFIPPDLNLLDLAQRAGFGFVRMDLFWPVVEPSPSRYDFSEYFPLMQALEARGMGAYFILAYANPVQYDGPTPFVDHWGPQTAATRTAYGQYALAAAKYFSGRGARLEIWNEPNIAQFWLPEPSPANYGRLAAEALRAVKWEVADIPVVIGATSLCDAGFLDRMFDIPGLGGADAVSIHPYRTIAPETFVTERILVQDVIERRTGRTDVPLYSGEWGYPSTLFGGRTDAAWKKQALYAIREILINLRIGVPKTVYYDIKDDGSDPQNVEHNYGLLTENGTPKPAYNAVKALYDLLPGRESGAARGYVGPGWTWNMPGAENAAADSWALSGVETRAGDVYGLVFHNASGQLAALWTSRTSAFEVKIPDNAAFRFYNMYGDTVTPARREGGFCSLSLDGERGPVYVKY